MLEVNMPPPRWGVCDRQVEGFGPACMSWGIMVWHELGDNPQAYPSKSALPVIIDGYNPGRFYTWQDILPRVEQTRKCVGLRDMIAQLPD